MSFKADFVSASILGRHFVSVDGSTSASVSSINRHLAPSAGGMTLLPSASSSALSAESPGRSSVPATSYTPSFPASTQAPQE